MCLSGLYEHPVCGSGASERRRSDSQVVNPCCRRLRAKRGDSQRLPSSVTIAFSRPNERLLVGGVRLR
jgi:hypothetical protein